MHDEFERAVTGDRPRRGLSPLGWILTTVGLFMIVGVFAAGWAVTKVAQRAREVAADLVSDLRPGELAAGLVSSLRAQERMLDMSPDEGLSWLRKLDRGDPAEALLERVVSAPARSLGDVRDRRSRDDGSERTLTVHSDEGDVRFDLQRDRDGATLVIDGPDGQVRLDLGRTRNGGFLTIDSDDGHARVDLVRTARGGTLTIDSDEGTVRIDATGGEDGARLEVETDDGEILRLGIGEDAAASVPGWMPRFDDMPDAPRPLYSLEGRDGSLGGVTWTDDETVEGLLDAVRARLEDEGYDLRAEHSGRDAGHEEGSLWARDASGERFVFVVAREHDDGTRVLLGFGERD